MGPRHRREEEGTSEDASDAVDVRLTGEAQRGQPREPLEVEEGGTSERGSGWLRKGWWKSGSVGWAVVGLATAGVAVVLALGLASSRAGGGSDGAATASVKGNYQAQGEGVVATDHPACSEVGSGVLSKGGNAVDAAVAAQLCLGVARPASSGLGGGFYLLAAWEGSQQARFLDARETAPSKAEHGMYDGSPGKSEAGGSAVATPAEGPGLAKAYNELGSGRVPWRELVRPARAMAEEGVALDAYTARALSKESVWQRVCDPRYANISRGCSVYYPDGKALRSGARVTHPQLAETLRALEDDMHHLQSRVFARAIADEVKSAGGVLTEDDVVAYKPVFREPYTAEIDGMEVVVPGPPSSGTVVALAAGALANLGGEKSEALQAHRRVEVLKGAFAARRQLADPAFAPGANNSAAAMVGRMAAESLANFVGDDRAKPSQAFVDLEMGVSGSGPEDKGGTSHLVAVDAHGGMASMTATVNSYLGSGLVSKLTGVTLNNEMDDFSTANEPNQYDLPYNSLNAVEPGKRPQSSMSPLLVFRGGRRVAALGASGGPRIVTASVDAFHRHLLLGQPQWEAISAPRAHHQLSPPTAKVEASEGLDPATSFFVGSDTIGHLKALGHNISRTSSGVRAVVQLASRVPFEDEFLATSDPRKLGCPSAASRTPPLPAPSS